MPAPIFSICIPAHNATKHIGECLESIHRQSYRDWEVIIIDDASEDGLAAVLESGNYLDGGRVSLHRMDENKGPYFCRKIGFQYSSGTHVMCLDADDALVDDDVLSKLAGIIVQEEPDVVLFNATMDSAAFTPWVDYGDIGLMPGFLDKCNVVSKYISTYALNNICFRVIRRDLLFPVEMDGAEGFFMCEDRLELAQVYLKAHSFFLLDEPLYYYRPTNSSTTHGFFRLDYCRQQSDVERTVDKLFSPTGDELKAQQKLFLEVWAHDMEDLSWGRTTGELKDCLKEMAADSYFVEAYRTIGSKGLRADLGRSIDLLGRGRYGMATRWIQLMARGKRIAKGV